MAALRALGGRKATWVPAFALAFVPHGLALGEVEPSQEPRLEAHSLDEAFAGGPSEPAPTPEGEVSQGSEPKWTSVLRGEDPTDPYALPDAPAPPTLPDLTHRAFSVSFENAFASLHSIDSSGSATAGRTFGWLERFEVEQVLAIRRWYLGAAHEMAAGSAPDSRLFLGVMGHPEVWGRAVWASRAGLTYGGGLGAILPVANRREESSATAVAETVRAVRPWDHLSFASDTFTLRPFVDVRSIDGPVVLQLRQGIDWARPGSASTELSSRTTLFVGYRPTELIGLGLEAWEVYMIRVPKREKAELGAPRVQDDARAAYALSPSVRVMTRMLQPALSFLVPIDKPLSGSLDDYWAIRLNFDIVLDSLGSTP